MSQSTLYQKLYIVGSDQYKYLQEYNVAINGRIPKIKQVSARWFDTIILTYDHELFIYRYGKPNKNIIVNYFVDKKLTVDRLYGSPHCKHFFILCRDEHSTQQRLFGFGNNGWRQLGVPTQGIGNREPIEIPFFYERDETILDIALGMTFSLFLTRTRGIPKDQNNIHPKLWYVLQYYCRTLLQRPRHNYENVCSVILNHYLPGNDHSDTRVYCCGKHICRSVSKNRSTYDVDTRKYIPYRVPYFDDKWIYQIASGSNYCLALSFFDNLLYTFGKCWDGQLGVKVLPFDYEKTNEKYKLKPNRRLRKLKGLIRRYKTDNIEIIQTFKEQNVDIVQIFTACKFSLVLDTRYRLWGFGEHYCHPLSTTNLICPEIAFEIPVKPSSLANLKITCGDFHTIILVDNKYLYGFGTNQQKQLNISNSPDISNNNDSEQKERTVLISQPDLGSLVNHHPIKSIFAAADCTFILTESHFRK